MNAKISFVRLYGLALALLFAFYVIPLLTIFAQDASEKAPENVSEKADKSAETAAASPEFYSVNIQRGKDYMRVYEDPNTRAGSLDTSIHHFEGEDGFSVDLIGAIHIAEKQYYQRLNQIFKNYDAVLYEVVAEEGTRPTAGKSKSSGSVIGTVQYQFGNMLGLVHQLGAIDYQPKNMVHADLSPTEFSQAMKNREDGFLVWYLRSVGYSLGQPSDSTDVKILTALFAPDRQKALRRALSKQMSEIGGEIDAMNGPNGSAIINDRNNKVMDQLDKMRKQGKKKVAIFYGAAHLPDMADKLEKRFQLQPKELQWIPAWTF